jgi:hypothetical protein
MPTPEERLRKKTEQWARAACIQQKKIAALIKALGSANQICRSALAIAKRRGNRTNWEALEKQLMKQLSMQAKLLNRKKEANHGNE